VLRHVSGNKFIYLASNYFEYGEILVKR